MTTTRRLTPLADRPGPPRFRDLQRSASAYQPPEGLIEAAEAAVALGVPLLLTGEPGTGKTQAAYFLADAYGVAAQHVFRLDVRSSTTAEDLTASLDTIAYFHAAHDPGRSARPLDPRDYYIAGPLFRAYRASEPCVVLIDEIDKAPRDFPNDLLNVLDQHGFVIRETQEQIRLPPGAPPPLVVITSNTERRLPEPFLRRCIFFDIQFTEALVRRAVQAHAADMALDARWIDAAIERFLALRDADLGLSRAPSTAELLNWLYVLRGRADLERLESARLGDLPMLSALIKRAGDRERLRHL